ncbi:calmodulin-A [Nematostella vectensis]|uniref:calmodulin-A n=1 Tax=Nematostella vectensis TaxID=45351 RepID=UPI00138FCE32|nr:calmodulin-A [Nematostella vectensis]
MTSENNKVQEKRVEDLSQEQLEEYRDAFEHFDKDSSGSITTRELGGIMRSLGENPTEIELQDMINSVDCDGNGLMNFDEFVKLMITKNQFMMDEEDMLEAFRMFDRDGRGYVMSSDLRFVLRHLEENIPEHEINDILQDNKQGWNRKIAFEEFKKMAQIEAGNTLGMKRDSIQSGALGYQR